MQRRLERVATSLLGVVALTYSSYLAAQAPMGDLECRVAVVAGVPTFVMNGIPRSGMCYSSYDMSRENLQRRVRQFAEAGCDIS